MFSTWRWNKKKKKEAMEFQYTALPATVNESWISTSSLPSPPPPPCKRGCESRTEHFYGDFLIKAAVRLPLASGLWFAFCEFSTRIISRICILQKFRSQVGTFLIYSTRGTRGKIKASTQEYEEGRDSWVRIATRYGLDGRGIESRWGWEFPRLSRPALGPTQLVLKSTRRVGIAESV
jgi:hypothetical protein